MSLEINPEDFWKEIDKRVVEHCIEKKLMSEEITKLREQVAAQTAVIERLTKRLVSTNIIVEVVCAIHPDFACAKYELAENMNALSTHTDSTQILTEVRRAERERAAKVCDAKAAGARYVYQREELIELAAAIRAME